MVDIIKDYSSFISRPVNAQSGVEAKVPKLESLVDFVISCESRYFVQKVVPR